MLGNWLWTGGTGYRGLWSLAKPTITTGSQFDIKREPKKTKRHSRHFLVFHSWRETVTRSSLIANLMKILIMIRLHSACLTSILYILKRRNYEEALLWATGLNRRWCKTTTTTKLSNNCSLFYSRIALQMNCWTSRSYFQRLWLVGNRIYCFSGLIPLKSIFNYHVFSTSFIKVFGSFYDIFHVF